MVVTIIVNDDRDGPSCNEGEEARVDVLRVVDAVRSALSSAGHTVGVCAIGTDFMGALHRIQKEAPDVVFNLCESLSGDARGEAVVAGVLEQLGVTFTGSPALALGLALHKDKAKALLRGSLVPTPDWQFFPEGAPAIAGCPDYPVIVKPAREDASVGISFGSVANDPESLREAVHRVWRMHQPALVERFVEGRELCVSLLGNAPRTLLPLREISFGPSFAGRPRIVSYLAKWDPGTPEFRDTKSVRCDLPPETESRVVECARRAFEVLGCRDYGRVDVRLDGDGTPYVIDVNPNCDLHPEAGFARAAQAAGFDYPSLVAMLLENALERARPHPTGRAAPRAGAGAAVQTDRELHTR
ncbi:MAG TPA: ATP-grasp domain-containing protein [Anaeromyxobacter sp.]|nr:ATP-grasp domain-containing protein [Anaeromyxobacter sp.]